MPFTAPPPDAAQRPGRVPQVLDVSLPSLILGVGREGAPPAADFRFEELRPRRARLSFQRRVDIADTVAQLAQRPDQVELLAPSAT